MNNGSSSFEIPQKVIHPRRFVVSHASQRFHSHRHHAWSYSRGAKGQLRSGRLPGSQSSIKGYQYQVLLWYRYSLGSYVHTGTHSGWMQFWGNCAMDFAFMFVMNECNDNNNKIAVTCVHKIYTYVCYLHRKFYLSSNYVVLVARINFYH